MRKKNEGKLILMLIALVFLFPFFILWGIYKISTSENRESIFKGLLVFVIISVVLNRLFQKDMNNKLVGIIILLVVSISVLIYFIVKLRRENKMLKEENLNGKDKGLKCYKNTEDYEIIKFFRNYELSKITSDANWINEDARSLILDNDSFYWKLKTELEYCILRNKPFSDSIIKEQGEDFRYILYKLIKQIGVEFIVSEYSAPTEYDKDKILKFIEKTHMEYKEFKDKELPKIQSDLDFIRYVNESQQKLYEVKREIEINNYQIRLYRPPIPQKVKDLVWNRDGGKCVICGDNEKLEFDHIIPYSKGGADTYRNLQLLCEKCNRSKSDKIG